MSMKLKFNIENMGNIDNATVTIKPLTIIAGENSSGKTFVTKSLYTILDSVYKNHFANTLSKNLRIMEAYNRALTRNLTNPAKIDSDFQILFTNSTRKLKDLINQLRGCLLEAQDSLVENNILLFEEIEDKFTQYCNNRKKIQKFKKYNYILDGIILHMSLFIKNVHNRKEVIIDAIESSLDIGFKKNFQITNLQSLIKRGNNKKLTLAIDTIGKIEIEKNNSISFDFNSQGIQKVQNVQNIIFFDSPVYIKIQKALESVQESNFEVENEDKYLKGYPEYLDQLYNYMNKEYIDIPDFAEISSEIQDYISGKLDIGKGGDIQYINKEGHSIPLSLTAMGISNIGLIDLLLRNNVINKDSFLIMDEPEVHLHPKWQVALANILYKIATNGANIIIATHSLDFLKAFEVILKNENENAEKIIAINQMPFDNEFTKLTELEKVNVVLDDLSKPFYDLYMQDI